jgi:hypothetical protein
MYKTKKGKEKLNNFIYLDTLYLHVKYPKLDVFKKWYSLVEGTDYQKLKAGIPAGEFVLKNGANLYKFSVCQHDARVFLTDRVDELVGENNGSGIWVQLGPKFLIHHVTDLHTGIKQLLKDIGVKGMYPITITRLDLAMDLTGVSIQSLNLNEFKRGWVGRSKVSSVFFNSRTRAMETINVGSRKSPIYLRIYDKVAQAIEEGDIDYWRDIWKGYLGPVTRVEWETKPKKGKFSLDLKEFDKFDGFSVRSLLVYLLKWGRLCVPDESDRNNRRWNETEFWKDVRKRAEEWLLGVDFPVSRFGKEFHPLSEGYAKQFAGNLSGALARFGDDGKPSWINLFEGLEKFGISQEKINRKAEQKAAVISRM